MASSVLEGWLAGVSPIELIPQPFQERLQEQIQVSRQLGHHRNLLVAATGTGKTVMAALDYAHLRLQLPRSRLLFVAHREEILQKSLGTFRIALRDYSFGELWVGGKRPGELRPCIRIHSKPSATGFDDLPADHFDVVIVDEFHHAAAKSYTSLLSHVQPLNCWVSQQPRNAATVYRYCIGSAIESRRNCACGMRSSSIASCPFAYYGIHDGIDLRDVPWRRGRG